MKTVTLLIGIFGGLLLAAAGCGHLLYADGPYRGRVLDAEMKQPIDGAAVVAVWSKETPMVAQPDITFYEAQETLTDQNGNFTIPGIVGGSPNPLAKIREPLFTIFKPGYEAYGMAGPAHLPEPEKDGRTIVELRRLATRQERLRNLDRVNLSYRIPEEKYPNLIRLRNIERQSLGLSPTHIPKEEGRQ